MNMTDILVGGTSIGQSIDTYPGCIVDSGTNILLLPANLYDALNQTFLKQCSTTKYPYVCDTQKTLLDGYCYPLTQDEINQ